MEKENKVDKFISNPKKALFVLATPVLISMAVETAYNLFDTAFVGRLGSDAIAAVSFAGPLFFLLIAINAGISTGMSSMIARFLGAKNRESAENTALHALAISIFFALLSSLAAFYILRPTLSLFGATGNVLELAAKYLQIIFVGTIFMLPSFTISEIFSSEGNTMLSMKIQIYALIVNTILDPILIYYLRLGVSGAALANVIATMLSLAASIYYLKNKSYLSLNLKYFKFSPSIIKEITVIGVPSTFMIFLISFYIVFLNKFMAHFGTDYVAAFGLVSRLEGVAILPPFGFSVALLTLTGMFYGAKRYDLLNKITYYSINISVLFSIFIGVIFFAWPKFFLSLFTSDQNLLSLGSQYLRLDVITFPLMAVIFTATRALQGLGTGVPGFVSNLIRIFVFAVPLSYVFVYKLNLNFLSIAYAMILGGIAASLVSLVWLKIKLKNVLKNTI